jgi:hypothetical protein
VEERFLEKGSVREVFDAAKDDPVARRALNTVDYEDIPPDAVIPEVQEPYPMRRVMTSSPEIIVSESSIGRETLVEIKQELVRQGVVQPPPGVERYAIAEVLELFTFVIVDGSLPASSSDMEKRQFVEKRLAHRLGPGGVGAIERIDLRPADETAVMMRVWCKVALRR